ncbi:MAG: hypothetical protein LH473_05575, partial [Chitinophagales bacterium]|nr:hypothetical protein [Chitinophagales bacterium]
MKKIFLLSAISILILTITFSFLKKNNFEKEKDEPSDWFLMQRAYPFNKVDYAAYKNALKEKAFMYPQNSLRDYLQWEPEGPINIGGRVQDIEMDPTNTSIIYVGSASGGIFKSKDAGTTWEPIFDAQPSLSIGDVAVCSTNPDLIYAGTGEPNCGGGSVTYDGAGIFKSIDAGNNWSYVGLDSTRNTGRIVIDPKNNDRVFAATMGDLFANGKQRGVYRSTDGGTTWKQVLFVSDSTGAVDLAINPGHPDTIYACMWERVRRFTYQKYYGPTCGIYRSYDGGDTWTQLSTGLPTTDIGRIGIDIAQSSPNVLYSIYTNNAGAIKGVYKTVDGGDTWTNIYTNTLSGMFASYGWWFSRIKADPTNPDIVFAIGFDTYRTINGGIAWTKISGSMHVDHHAIYIHPLDNNLVYAGNDGGVYKSINGGTSWTHFTNIPNNQFYTSEVDYNNPTNLYGGTQDNGVYRTTTGNIDDYKILVGGDGFYVLVDPTDNNYIYGESQYGALSRSTNAGNSFSSATNGISNSARKNWNSPVAFNPQNTKSLYFGANKVYKTVNRAAYWDAISDDLTNGYVSSNVTYATITSIAASPIDSNIIWAGTDDGNVWVTENNGTLWTKVSDALPDRWVTRVVCDLNDSHVAYVTFSGYKYYDNITHVYRTADLGQTWQSVSGNMPDVPANDLIIDPILDSTLYLATDAGVFYTSNLGNEWFVLGYDLPTVPVTDLTFH